MLLGNFQKCNLEDSSKSVQPGREMRLVAGKFGNLKLNLKS